MAEFPSDYQVIPGQPNAAVNPETGHILWRSGDRKRIYDSPQSQQGIPATDEQLRQWGIAPPEPKPEPEPDIRSGQSIESLFRQFTEPSEEERRLNATIQSFLEELGVATRERRALVKPVEELLFAQAKEALATGGIGARIPFIQQATERSKQATARTLTQTGEELTRVGLTGTPFGQRVLGEVRALGEQATAAVPTDIVGEFLAQVPGLVTETGGQVSGALVGGTSGAVSALDQAVSRAIAAITAATTLSGQRTALDVANIGAASTRDIARIQAEAETRAARSQASGRKGAAALGGIFDILPKIPSPFPSPRKA